MLNSFGRARGAGRVGRILFFVSIGFFYRWHKTSKPFELSITEAIFCVLGIQVILIILILLAKKIYQKPI